MIISMMYYDVCIDVFSICICIIMYCASYVRYARYMYMYSDVAFTAYIFRAVRRLVFVVYMYVYIYISHTCIMLSCGVHMYLQGPTQRSLSASDS